MTTNTTKQTITVDVPEGYEIDQEKDHKNLQFGMTLIGIPLRRKKPIRVTHELVSETPRRAKQHELFSQDKSGLKITIFKNEGESAGTYFIWREIKGEGDE